MAAEDSVLSLLVTSACPDITILDESTYDADDVYYRNLSIKQPDGSYIDLGGSQQAYSLTITKSTFTDASQTGETFTFSVCGDDLVYTIENIYSDASFTCALEAISSAINESDGEVANFNASVVDDVIILQYIEPGIPSTFSIDYSAGNTSTFYTLTETLPGSPSLEIYTSATPANDTVTYTPSEDGGQYIVKLTIWTDLCDRYSTTEYVWNWCYTYTELDKCFIDLVRQEECGCGCKKNKRSKATELRNKIDAAKLEEELIGSGPDVQKIIDSALAICDGSDCGCKCRD